MTTQENMLLLLSELQSVATGKYYMVAGYYKIAGEKSKDGHMS